ncbi:chitinase 8 precursor [Tribolium castaneum]|uniref:chitinase n=1 Tax=Tribolium castaneum TaxID=7070 RepID=Q0Z941_TRICA|nr:chitinase 8 precursor [Tribolium castaneum]ABG47446.1 chitinase 8 [Tribolium castaneum]EFA06693.1 putative chitinase 2-like Protein [Tribolium castaneum]|eukprot:NP_001038094.1 chitinase 8 precursor [Tribolium castaneum]
MSKALVASFLLVYFSGALVSATTDKVVCYWGTWSTYRWGNGRFTVDHIDPYLCTHIIYSFVGLQADGNVRHLDEYLDVDAGTIAKLNALKVKNPNLKTLIAIGGWNEGSETYSQVAADAAKRATFIKSALNLVQKWGFDGFDLDWEYPGQRGGAAADIQNYATLIKEFREVWDQHGLLLTAAVAAAGPSVDLSYHVPSLSKYLDFINVMAYDLHGSWESVTGQNAPLYASSIDVEGSQKLLNVDASIRGWIERGADPGKLVLGLGVYGRSFTLASASNNKLGAPIVAGGDAGRYTGERGMMGYNEIVEAQNAGGWTTVWDDEQKTPYMYKGNQWVGYDNPKSIAIKVQYAKSLNLAGVMIWSIETDDFNGLSGTKYQILNAINAALKSDEIPPEPVPTPEPQPTQTTESEPTQASEQPTESSTTQKPQTTKTPESGNESDGVCTKEGIVRDPSDCSVYYTCVSDGSKLVSIQRKCNHGLVYDLELNICNYPQVVQC